MFFYCIVFMAFCGMSENQQVTSTKKIAADNKIVLYAATLSCKSLNYSLKSADNFQRSNFAAI